jgi:hypothetical protein
MGPQYPDWLVRALVQTQEWMQSALKGDNPPDHEEYWAGGNRPLEADPEALFEGMEWACEYADLLPADRDVGGKEDALVVTVGPYILDEGFRMAVDHAALFARGSCKRIWLVSDNWLMGDFVYYLSHLKALVRLGVEIRLILVTPWGWTEIPISRALSGAGRMYWKSGLD